MYAGTEVPAGGRKKISTYIAMSDWTQRAKRYHDAIHTVLLKEWDPIGVADIPEAQDEYDAYVAGVYKRLISRASEEEMFTYLWEIETEYMGLCGNSRHTRAIAKRLLGLIAFIEQRAEKID